MTMLDGPRLEPASGGKPDALVILLHGYGSNGADLISLAPHWRGALPDALFVSPNAPERCAGAPGGFQWWGLSDFSRPALAAGARRAAPALDAFIDRQLADHGLAEDRVVLVGFSQGTMMALHVGLRRSSGLACILGYSGLLVGPEHLKDVAGRPTPPILLIHGDADTVIPVEQVVAEIEAVTQADVLRVARRLIAPDALYLSVIGPYDDQGSFADLLQA